MVAETAKNLGQGAAKAVGSGVRSNSPMAQMIHAARIEAEKQAALEQAAGGLNKENRAKLAEMIRDAQKHVAKNSQ